MKAVLLLLGCLSVHFLIGSEFVILVVVGWAVAEIVWKEKTYED